MDKSKWKCSILLVFWAIFTANLSQRIDLFPKYEEMKKKPANWTLTVPKDSLTPDFGLQRLESSPAKIFVLSSK